MWNHILAFGTVLPTKWSTRFRNAVTLNLQKHFRTYPLLGCSTSLQPEWPDFPGSLAVPGTPWMTRTFNLPKWYNSSPSFRKMVSTSASKLATLDMCDQLRLPALYMAGNGVNCFPGSIPAASWRAKQRSSLRQYHIDRAAGYGSIEESVVSMVDLGKWTCRSESIPLCIRLRFTGWGFASYVMKWHHRRFVWAWVFTLALSTWFCHVRSVRVIELFLKASRPHCQLIVKWFI